MREGTLWNLFVKPVGACAWWIVKAPPGKKKTGAHRKACRCTRFLVTIYSLFFSRLFLRSFFFATVFSPFFLRLFLSRLFFGVNWPSLAVGNNRVKKLMHKIKIEEKIDLKKTQVLMQVLMQTRGRRLTAGFIKWPTKKIYGLKRLENVLLWNISLNLLSFSQTDH